MTEQWTPPPVCPECGAAQLRRYGGTQRYTCDSWIAEDGQQGWCAPCLRNQLTDCKRALEDILRNLPAWELPEHEIAADIAERLAAARAARMGGEE